MAWLHRSAAGVTIDATQSFTFPGHGYATRCGWSPFVGLQGLGRVTRVEMRNAVVWEDGQLVATPGSGRPLELLADPK